MWSEHEPTATPLEQATEAAIACLGAWIYPSDDEVRETAHLACANIGVNYFDAVARVIDAADAANTKAGRPFNERVADQARYEVARVALANVDRLRAAHDIRHGIAASGYPIEQDDET